MRIFWGWKIFIKTRWTFEGVVERGRLLVYWAEGRITTDSSSSPPNPVERLTRSENTCAWPNEPANNERVQARQTVGLHCGLLSIQKSCWQRSARLNSGRTSARPMRSDYKTVSRKAAVRNSHFSGITTSHWQLLYCILLPASTRCNLQISHKQAVKVDEKNLALMYRCMTVWFLLVARKLNSFLISFHPCTSW